MKYLKIVIDWIGHEDGTVEFMIRAPNAEWEQQGEGGTWWDVIIKDWEHLK